MPKKYWRNLPEATLIPTLLRDAPQRVETMMKKSAAKQDGTGEEWRPAPVPDTPSLTTLRKAALGCTACPLYKNATQTVFGEGSKRAKLILLGEQPGDQEDLSGKPFVGPAGQLLDRALEEAGIDRNAVYVTNTVKHFKWEPRGKRRIHQKPSSRDFPPAVRGWKRSLESLGRASSFVWDRPPRRRFSARRFASPGSAGRCSNPSSRRVL